MNRKIKWFAMCIVFTAICIPCTLAQKQTSGTIIVFGVSDQFITIAADSRTVERDTGEQKTVCKVTVLDNKFVFAVTGMNFLKSRQLLWDAYAQAKNSFDMIKFLGIRNNPEFANAIATRWAQNAQDVFTQMTLTDSASFWRLVKDTHARAFFAGFDESGKIGITEARITLTQSTNTLGQEIFSHKEGNTTRFFAIGEPQIAEEFILLKSDRAKREYKSWQGTVGDKSPVQQASLRTIDLVRLSIKYLPSSAGVGPPIHAVILEKNGTVRWVPGKACPQKNETTCNTYRCSQKETVPVPRIPKIPTPTDQPLFIPDPHGVRSKSSRFVN